MTPLGGVTEAQPSEDIHGAAREGRRNENSVPKTVSATNVPGGQRSGRFTRRADLDDEPKAAKSNGAVDASCGCIGELGQIVGRPSVPGGPPDEWVVEPAAATHAQLPQRRGAMPTWNTTSL